MPPPMRLGAAPNNFGSQYQYGAHPQAHGGNSMAPPLGSNPGFMNANSLSNPFAMNGNSLSVGNFGSSGLGMPGGTGLASQQAQMSFASASMQQPGHNGMGESGARGQGNKGGRIRDVWKGNLHEEMAILRDLVEHYPYIAMDTVFPGVVARPMGGFNGKSDYHYQCLRCNVDLLNILQLGISLFNEDGESPPATSDREELTLSGGRKYGPQQVPCTWQFNFKFSLKDDMYSEQAIESHKLAGVAFESLEEKGIDPFEFGALLMSSGLVCDEDVRWISFHAGYDFGYLTKVLLRLPLPDDEVEFDKYMKKFFPSFYDFKHLMRSKIRLNAMGQLTPQNQEVSTILEQFDRKQGLENAAEIFKIKRQGVAHQAGSDSLLTGKLFFKMKEKIYNGDIGDEHLGKVWGLEAEHPSNPVHRTPQHYHSQLQENSTPTQNGTYANGAPSTPNNGNVGLANASTPVPNNNGAGIGPMTPGGGSGVFGNFQFGK